MSTKKSVAIAFIIIGVFVVLYYGVFQENRVAYEKEWTFSAGELDTLLIENSSHDLQLEFIKSADHTNRIHISGHLDKALVKDITNARIENQTLSIPMKSEMNVRWFNFNMQPTRQTMTIALAEDTTLDTIKIHSTSGDSTFKNVRANMVELTSTSGNLSVDHVLAEELILQTTSGSIDAGQLEANLQAKISANSGEIEIQQILSENVILQSTSGDINAGQITGHVQAKSNSGHIEIDQLDGFAVVKTTSGSVEIHPIRPTSLDVQTTSGQVQIDLPPGFNGTFDLHSNSGNIKAPDSRNESDDIIKVRTTSGNIRIKEQGT